MQGEQAAESIIGAMNRVYSNMELFDCVVIIRGGGATSDLNCFDDYNLALNITQFPLPVIVGIGHERDITVLDYVANKSIKTPTAVAEFLISQIANCDEYLNELSGEIADRIKDILSDEKLTLSALESQLPSLVINKIEKERNSLSLLQSRLLLNIRERVGNEKVRLASTYTSIKEKFERTIERETNRISNIENKIELLSPDRILKRGYSISIKDGYAIKSASELKEGDNIKVIFADGEAESEVKKVKNL